MHRENQNWVADFARPAQDEGCVFVVAAGKSDANSLKETILGGFMGKAEVGEILLVEDYEPDARYLGHLLRRSRIINPLKVVSDGREALDYLFRRGNYRDRESAPLPKVVLLDIRMPKVDGVEVLKRIKEDARTRLIPVIVVTGSEYDLELEKVREAGADGVLSKPIDMGVLRKLCSGWGVEFDSVA